MGSIKTIAKNTSFLYVRSILTLIISLFTSRIVLSALGVEDFGVYSLVGGLVTALSFINGTMTAATQRFLAYEIGIGDKDSINKVFITAVNVHGIISVVIFLLIEIIGSILIATKLDLGNTSVTTAQILLLFSNLSMVLTINSVPYNSMLVSYEDMSYFAYIDILGAVLKLVVAYALFLLDTDRLLLYGILMFAVSLIIRTLYVFVCKKKYEEAAYHFYWDTLKIKNMLSFSGWTSVAAFAFMIRNQGMAVILNMFFGPILNAAISIANQVNSAIRTFSQNFQLAFSPQITKSYAQNDFHKMNTLIQSGAKISVFLMIIFSLPFLIETDYILTLWLKNVPDYCCVLVRIILIETIIQTMTCTGNIAIRATGEIRNFELTYNTIQILALPAILVWLYFQKIYFVPFLIMVFFVFISSFVKIYFMKIKIQGFKSIEYIIQVMLIPSIIGCLAVIVPFILQSYISYGFGRLILNTVIAELSCFACMMTFGLSIEEKKLVKNLVFDKIIRKRK